MEKISNAHALEHTEHEVPCTVSAEQVRGPGPGPGPGPGLGQGDFRYILVQWPTDGVVPAPAMYLVVIIRLGSAMRRRLISVRTRDEGCGLVV